MAPAVPTTFPVGRVLVSLVGASAAAGAFAADWNETHIHNPRWPPHAKFHNAQTMVFAVELGAISLYQLWGRRPYTRTSLRWGTVFAGLYWAAQAPAILFPGTALTDPEHAGRQPHVLGVEMNQLTGQVTVLYPLLAVGYLLEARRLRRLAARPDHHN